jgi:hypothetical protein
MSLHYAERVVKTAHTHTQNAEPFNPLDGAAIVEWFKYYDEIAKRQVTMAVGYDNGVACSDRTRGGKLHESNAFNIRADLLDRLKSKGYDTFLIRIHWKRVGRTIGYYATLHTIETFGTLENRYDGLQYSLPLEFWSIDGQTPTATAQPAKVAPVAEQPALFDYAEPVRRGRAY